MSPRTEGDLTGLGLAGRAWFVVFRGSGVGESGRIVAHSRGNEPNLRTKTPELAQRQERSRIAVETYPETVDGGAIKLWRTAKLS